MRKINIIKLFLVLFFGGILLLCTWMIYQFKFTSHERGHEIDTIILPGNNEVSHLYTMPYDGNLWVRLRRADGESAFPENGDLLSYDDIGLMCEAKHHYNEMRTIENTASVNNEKRICRQMIEYGKIVTSLYDSEKSNLIESFKFPEYDMSLFDISLAGFSGLKRGQRLEIKINSTKSEIHVRVTKKKYKLIIEAIER